MFIFLAKRKHFYLRNGAFLSCSMAEKKAKLVKTKTTQWNQCAAASSGTSLQGRQMDTFIFPDLFANVNIPVQALALQIII